MSDKIEFIPKIGQLVALKENSVNPMFGFVRLVRFHRKNKKVNIPKSWYYVEVVYLSELYSSSFSTYGGYDSVKLKLLVDV
jgi:hypothetical protein